MPEIIQLPLAVKVAAAMTKDTGFEPQAFMFGMMTGLGLAAQYPEYATRLYEEADAFCGDDGEKSLRFIVEEFPIQEES